MILNGIYIVHGQGDFKLLTDGIEETRQALDMVTTQRIEAEKALLELCNGT